MTERIDSAGDLSEAEAGVPLPAPNSPDAPDALPAVALLAWLSPSFPVGSFAFSHGLEWAVEAGDVKDRATLTAWIGSLIDSGGCYNDAVLLSVAWRAMDAGDMRTLDECNALAVGLAGSRERRLETVAQGNAFLAAIAAAWGLPAISAARTHLAADAAFPIAVGIAAAAHGIARAVTLEAFCLAAVQNLVSASIRLNAIGQTDGQRTIAGLLPATRALARSVLSAGLDAVGAAAFRSDIAALQHETQYTRLFRS